MSQIINHTEQFDKNKELAEHYYSRGRYIECYKHYTICLSFSKSTTKKHKNIKQCIDELLDEIIGSNLHVYLEEMNQQINMKLL